MSEPNTPMGSEAEAAAARSRAYAFFAWAFEYPDAERVADVRAGALGQALRAVLEAAAPALLEDVDWPALCEAGESDDDLAVEYTRLFDVGASGPPCPLYGGLYGGARMKTMEEVVRFYRHFGLRVTDQAPRELPDHLCTELEFLHFLAYQEAQALSEGGDPGPFRRAQRDFVARHPGHFVPALRKRMAEHEPPPFFRELTRQLERFLARDGLALQRLEPRAAA